MAAAQSASLGATAVSAEVRHEDHLFKAAPTICYYAT